MATGINYNIALALQNVAAEQAQDTGLVCRVGRGYRSWTFGRLGENSATYAAALHKAGVRQGQRVMLMVRPSMEFVCLTFALFRLGAVVILIDPGMGYRNLRRCIGRVAPDVLVGIPAAQLFSRIFPASFRTVGTRICVGPSFGVLGTPLQQLCKAGARETPPFAAARDDLAAIIFTTGSTGPPKGVQYTHGIFHAQLQLIREYYGIGPGQVDQPGFPLFALFSTALGARAVIPDMDPARPAKVDPARFVRSIIDHRVTYSFGSPAIWNVVSRYCLERNIVLPLRKILMAGAPVAGELIERVAGIMSPDGEIHTPYGATECLPIASISGREILVETWPRTRQGKGTCVGRALPGIDIRIIRAVEGEISSWDEVELLPPGEIGEIVVRGPVVTRSYDNNPGENAAAKITEGSGFRHRMGDMGYLDEADRLWFCGRKAHRVMTAGGVMYTVPCEAIFNEHPEVQRSALVGVGKEGEQLPVLVVELVEGGKTAAWLTEELRQLAAANELTATITTFLYHPSFPVDIRHNAKIFREKLAVWAADQLHEHEQG
ncbi:MAG: fatty acid CoA ligase family protein [Desulfobulbaceae bacterium]|nr:fatty acid CoA ligase family protein [Desulfobulbaceae bacterium]